MGIIFHEETKTFHLTNGEISYIMTVLPNGHLGNLYYGKAIRDREDFCWSLSRDLCFSMYMTMTDCSHLSQ